jgi:hypothetical protein
MATDEKPLIEQTAPSRSRGWRIFFAGVVIGGLVPFALAVLCGPHSKATYEDPLTGRHMHESIWLGMTTSSHIEENEVSKWADRNSIQGIYPARYGWSVITREARGWFSRSSIACGGGLDIPNQIFRGQIALDGLTREQALQQYQTDLVAAYNEHGSMIGAQRKWLAYRK